ncbi:MULTISPECIES: DUF3043 domain-containing protein [Streptomyces]|uniref:DUF3043 domain-containing protein n=1 Tax=Streptomyces radiopugnans TaxID=403935 RepID=A0A1H8ZQQ6_9ACTN|nr:DUF3043 domain-containing protein [Streptomyces radiopugnans]SEP66826.1 Protein of unknown function [Streptomyces radiopugnans]
MFRSRSRDEQAAPPRESAELTKQRRDPQAPKGRPTPKRSEAEALRRAVAKPPADRKEAARRAREARRAELARQREALAGGDERYLPARDRGPVRRYARDFVDAKWHVAEFFLPLAVVILILSMMPSMQVKNASLLLWMGVIVMIVVDSVLTGFRLKKALAERFPDENRRGAVAYALMRTLQMRRMRLPKPQIARGEAPRR